MQPTRCERAIETCVHVRVVEEVFAPVKQRPARAVGTRSNRCDEVLPPHFLRSHNAARARRGCDGRVRIPVAGAWNNDHQPFRATRWALTPASCHMVQVVPDTWRKPNQPTCACCESTPSTCMYCRKQDCVCHMVCVAYPQHWSVYENEGATIQENVSRSDEEKTPRSAT
jgi:hypothetical protein